jgi:hypothetical protein
MQLRDRNVKKYIQELTWTYDLNRGTIGIFDTSFKLEEFRIELLESYTRTFNEFCGLCKEEKDTSHTLHLRTIGTKINRQMIICKPCAELVSTIIVTQIKGY